MSTVIAEKVIRDAKGNAHKSPLSIAFDMGRRAFYKNVTDSPYKRESMLEKEWKRGFNTAYFEQQSRLIGA